MFQAVQAARDCQVLHLAASLQAAIRLVSTAIAASVQRQPAADMGPIQASHASHAETLELAGMRHSPSCAPNLLLWLDGNTNHI